MTEIEEKHKIVKLKDLNANLGPDADLVNNHPHHNNNISGLKGPFLLQGSNIVKAISMSMDIMFLKRKKHCKKQ